MSHSEYHPAQLNAEALQALQDLEKELGRTLIAYEHDEKPAKLTQAEIERVKSLEECLGATVIAY